MTRIVPEFSSNASLARPSTRLTSEGSITRPLLIPGMSRRARVRTAGEYRCACGRADKLAPVHNNPPGARVGSSKTTNSSFFRSVPRGCQFEQLRRQHTLRAPARTWAVSGPRQIAPKLARCRQAFAQAGGQEGNQAADLAGVTAKLFPGFREIKIACAGELINGSEHRRYQDRNRHDGP
jgi:hypothetical protein